MQAKSKFITILVLATIAFGNAVYLTTQAYSLKAELTKNVVSYGSPCDINSTFSCSNVLLAPASQVFGVPFPAIAMVVYPIIFLIALLGYLGICRKSFHILAAMALGGACFNGYFIYQEAVNIGSYCPLCLMCSAIIVMIFGLSVSEVVKK